MTNDVQGICGNIVMYSLSSSLKIDWEELLEECKKNSVDSTLLPRKRDKGILEIKEVRRLLVKFFKKCDGVLIRNNGGCFYIPQKKSCEWYKYELTLRAFEGVDIISFEMAPTETNKKLLAVALLDEVKGNFIDEIYNLVNKKIDKDNSLKSITENFIDYIGVSSLKRDAQNNLRYRLVDIKDKVIAYQRYLNGDLSYIKNNIDKVIKGIDEHEKKRLIDNW